MKKIIKKLTHRIGIDIRRLDTNIPLETKLHFLHIGKTGGSELKRRFNAINKMTGKTTILNRGHQILGADLASSDNYIISLRDPLRRFESAFHSLRSQGVRDLSEVEKQLFKRFPGVNDIAQALRPDSPHRSDAVFFMLYIRHFSQRQANFLRGIDYIQRPPMFVFRSESLDNDFEVFCEAIGVEAMDIPFGNSNSTPAGDSYEQLNAENAEIIRGWYAEDELLWSTLKGVWQRQ